MKQIAPLTPWQKYRLTCTPPETADRIANLRSTVAHEFKARWRYHGAARLRRHEFTRRGIARCIQSLRYLISLDK